MKPEAPGACDAEATKKENFQLTASYAVECAEKAMAGMHSGEVTLGMGVVKALIHGISVASSEIRASRDEVERLTAILGRVGKVREFPTYLPEWPVQRRLLVMADLYDPDRLEGGCNWFTHVGAARLMREASISISEASSRTAFENGARWKHKKRGTIYTVLASGTLQCEEPIADDASVTIYRGEDGRFWVRPTREFYDASRFEPLDPLPEPPK